MAQTIMSYFKENPQAKDTLEGIFQFWLTRQQIRDELPVLHAVLLRLTARGMLREEQQAGVTFYALVKETE